MLTPIPNPKTIPTARAVSLAAKNKPHGEPLELRRVLSTIGEHEPVRRLVLDHFKARGGDLDAWHDRRHRARMADALTHAEDVLEIDRPRAAAREALRAVRRRLESEALT